MACPLVDLINYDSDSESETEIETVTETVTEIKRTVVNTRKRSREEPSGNTVSLVSEIKRRKVSEDLGDFISFLERNGKLSNLDFSKVPETSSKQYINIAFRSLFEEDYYRFMDENNLFPIQNELTLGKILRQEFQRLRPDIHELILEEANKKCPPSLRITSTSNEEERELYESIPYLRDEERELQEDISSLREEKRELQEDISSLREKKRELQEDISSFSSRIAKFVQLRENIVDILYGKGN